MEQHSMRPARVNEFRAGDCVQLKTGGYLMTVAQVFPFDPVVPVERVGCVWFDLEGRVHSEDFRPETLRRWLLDESLMVGMV